MAPKGLHASHRGQSRPAPVDLGIPAFPLTWSQCSHTDSGHPFALGSGPTSERLGAFALVW